MDSVAQDSITTIFAKDTWSVEDYDQLVKELSKTAEASRVFRDLLDDLETANPQPRGGVAMKIGVGLYMLSNTVEALTVLAEATDNKDRRYFQGLCYKALRQFDKAADEFERAKAKGWDNPQMDAQMIEIQAMQGKGDIAQKALTKVAGKLSKADGFYLQGLIYDIAGLAPQACEQYLKAIEADPIHSGANFRLAYFYDLHGDEEQALELYKQSLTRPPVNISTLMNMAVLYEDMGKYEKALNCLERVLRSSPAHLRARLFLKDVRSAMTMYYDEEHAKRIARRNAVLDIPVTDFELSVRARNCLKKMCIRTLGDLVRINEPELLAYKNFGETSLREIKEMLTAKNLRLGQALEDTTDFVPAAEPTPPTNEGVLATPIERVEFSIRARRALENLNVKVLGDLSCKSEAELLACKNFGQTSLNEIRQRLAEYGLQLRESN
jgi:DNA-directed RNA polymerase subunit alpha